MYYKKCPACKRGVLYVSIKDGKERCTNGDCPKSKVRHLSQEHRTHLSKIKRSNLPAALEDGAQQPLGGKV